jgi:hypothetical protein
MKTEKKATGFCIFLFVSQDNEYFDTVKVFYGYASEKRERIFLQKF